MDSAGFRGRKPLQPENPMMKSSRSFTHHNTPLPCIVKVRKPAAIQPTKVFEGFSLQMHRIGDFFLGLGA
jgi:hypothetical protein